MRDTLLGNGVRVLSEEMPWVRSVSVGVWVRTGSAHEAESEAGASHLLEHMVFKGTSTRSAHEIALALESLGGSLDAYTSREQTSFQARVLDDHLPVALDVLHDLTLQPTLSDADLELERAVVLEEIAQVEDTPDDQVFDLHGERLWSGHPYGRPILGTAQSVGAMRADALRRLHAERYLGRNLVVAAAGNVAHDDLVERVAAYFGELDAGPEPPSVPAPPSGLSGDERNERDSAQTHVVIGTLVPDHSAPERYPLVLLAAALGGGMSSRLFQRVREELALCYSVYTFQSFYRAGGMSGVYVGTRPATADLAVSTILDELAKVASEGLPADELEQTKRQVKGQITLSLESTSSRLYRVVSFALHDEPFLPIDDLLARIDAVTEEEVTAAAAIYFDPDRQLVLRLGPS
jgi:predicted Zn-dependent peptidase